MEVTEKVSRQVKKSSCHGDAKEASEGLDKVVLVGSPNAGKSVIFGSLTDKYVTVSKNSGALQGIPLVVSIVTLALFIPCIAQFSMTIKERGLKMALGMAAFIFPFAFVVGYAVNLILTTLGVAL